MSSPTSVLGSIANPAPSSTASLSSQELSRLSSYDPQRIRIDPSTFTPQQTAMFAGNRAALKVYGGSMTDGTLRGRLQVLTRPALVVWGEADRVVDPDYGRAFAEAIPHARFQLLAGAGHVPQVETPEPGGDDLALHRPVSGAVS